MYDVLGKFPGAIARRVMQCHLYMADYLVQACSPMFNLPVSNMLCVSSESGHVLELELLVLFKLQSIDGTALQLMAVHF